MWSGLRIRTKRSPRSRSKRGARRRRLLVSNEACAKVSSSGSLLAETSCVSVLIDAKQLNQSGRIYVRMMQILAAAMLLALPALSSDQHSRQPLIVLKIGEGPAAPPPTSPTLPPPLPAPEP